MFFTRHAHFRELPPDGRDLGRNFLRYRFVLRFVKPLKLQADFLLLVQAHPEDHDGEWQAEHDQEVEEPRPTFAAAARGFHHRVPSRV